MFGFRSVINQPTFQFTLYDAHPYKTDLRINRLESPGDVAEEIKALPQIAVRGVNDDLCIGRDAKLPPNIPADVFATRYLVVKTLRTNNSIANATLFKRLEPRSNQSTWKNTCVSVPGNSNGCFGEPIVLQ